MSKEIVIPNWIFSLGLRPSELALWLWGLSKPKGFDFSIDVAAKELKINHNTISSYKKTLVDKGLLTISQEKENGRYGKAIWTFYEKPLNFKQK